ncbi:MAG: GNAT family N-acetyltransferase [Shimia sp.]
MEPDQRGTGRGRALLDTCIGHARLHGFTEMILSTHAEHIGARHLYTRRGFKIVRSEPITAYGVPITEEDWLLTDLS